jgi:hypothetical protein
VPPRPAPKTPTPPIDIEKVADSVEGIVQRLKERVEKMHPKESDPSIQRLAATMVACTEALIHSSRSERALREERVLREEREKPQQSDILRR